MLKLIKTKFVAFSTLLAALAALLFTAVTPTLAASNTPQTFAYLQQKPQEAAATNTQQLVNLTWSIYHGIPIAMAVAPIINMSGKAAFDLYDDPDGIPTDIKRSSVPSQGLVVLLKKIMQRSQRYYLLTEHPHMQAPYRLQISITDYVAEYGSRRENLPGVIASYAKRLSTAMQISAKTGHIALQATLYESTTGKIINEYQIAISQNECFPAHLNEAFTGIDDPVLNRFLHYYPDTLIGQVAIAAFNDLIFRITKDLIGGYTLGRIQKIDNNILYLDLNRLKPKKQQKFHLLYHSATAGNPPAYGKLTSAAVIGTLKTMPNEYPAPTVRAYPIDFHPDSVIPGDWVRSAEQTPLLKQQQSIDFAQLSKQTKAKDEPKRRWLCDRQSKQ